MLVNFTGPVAGSPTFLPVCLRQGKSVTTVQVTVRAEGNLAAQIIFTFGGNRDSSLVVSGQPDPLIGSPEEYELFTPKEYEPFAPKFVANFDTRLVGGSRPVSGAEEGYIRVVTRHCDIESRVGIESFVAIADVLPPAALGMAKTVAPVSSVTWMMNMLTDDPVTEDGWWQIAARITAAENGYSSQQMNVWALDGTPVAEGMQSVAVFF
jgi:acyl-CoA thioesterase